jgi:hypothetical protein
MQIDESATQCENADSPIDESSERDSNSTAEIAVHAPKQEGSNRSMFFGILTSAALPQYFLMEVASEFTRNSPQILKCVSPLATESPPRGLPSNVPLPISCREGGSIIDDNETQPLNASCPMQTSLDPHSNETFERDRHSMKQPMARFSTDEGMQMAESDEQEENAASGKDTKLEPDSNVTSRRELHEWQQLTPSFSTEDGTQIDKSAKHSEKAYCSIDVSLDPDSNVTIERDLHR